MTGLDWTGLGLWEMKFQRRVLHFVKVFVRIGSIHNLTATQFWLKRGYYVDYFKELIEEKMRVAPSGLTYSGSTLQDGHTLAEYSINSGSTIYMQIECA